MEWSDEGVVLSVRPHGETASIVELYTRSHGRHLGMVHGGRSRLMRPILQMGNHVDVVWKARLADQLGQAKLELRRGYAAAAMEEARTLAGLTSLCALCRLLPERDPHPNLFEVTLFVLSFLDDATVWPALMVRWEMALLEELGFGLDLTECASTGTNDNLVYVSPRSGRAVSASAGEPYKDRMLALPQFLVKGRQASVTDADVAAGLKLTEYFLKERVTVPRDEPWPDARSRLAQLLTPKG